MNSRGKALLGRGYLPRELPPLFESISFAKVGNATSLPEVFTKKKPEVTKPVTFSLARFEGRRRQLSAPNPVNFFRLSNVISGNMNKIEKCWGRSTFAISTPSTIGERAFNVDRSMESNRTARARVGARYLLKADIAQFYHSIYTHAVTWALSGKELAKTAAFQADKSILANVLDAELRAGQDKESFGIPIGPDTSLCVSELITSRIDEEFLKRTNPIGALRIVDDMEFSFRDLRRAESALLHLEDLVQAYALRLNPKKTQILELPCSHRGEFHRALRGLLPKSAGSAMAIQDYFDTIFFLKSSFPDEPVIRYSVASLKGKYIKESSWELVQALLWQCVLADPGCFASVIDIFWANTHREDPLQLDTSLASITIGELIRNSAPGSHESEIVWAIWFSILFDIKISSNIWSKICKVDNDFVAVATRMAQASVSNASDIDSSHWDKWIEEGCWQGPHWLYAYECAKNGWGHKNFLDKALPDLAVKFLRKENVTFINDKSAKQFKTSDVKPPKGHSGY